MQGEWDSGRVGCWESGMLGEWDAGRVGFRESGMQGEWDVGRVGCRESGMQGEWDVGRRYSSVSCAHVIVAHPVSYNIWYTDIV